MNNNNKTFHDSTPDHGKDTNKGHKNQKQDNKGNGRPRRPGTSHSTYLGLKND